MHCSILLCYASMNYSKNSLWMPLSSSWWPPDFQNGFLWWFIWAWGKVKSHTEQDQVYRKLFQYGDIHLVMICRMLRALGAGGWSWGSSHYLSSHYSRMWKRMQCLQKAKITFIYSHVIMLSAHPFFCSKLTQHGQFSYFSDRPCIAVAISCYNYLYIFNTQSVYLWFTISTRVHDNLRGVLSEHGLNSKWLMT